MKTPPTEPGLYLHIDVCRTQNSPEKDRAYICRVGATGRFWHPVSLFPEDVRGAFVRIPEHLHEAAWAEAKEVFVEMKAKDILRTSGYDRNRYLKEVDPEFRELVKARMMELDPEWKP
jgi:hypothetical protein